MYRLDNKDYDVRISERVTLSVYEAAAYTGIGTNKLHRMAAEPGCNFVIYLGAKRRFKRKQLEEYLEAQYSI